jgi:cystathionine beta-synthase
MQLLHEGIEFDRQDIATVMGKPLPSLEETTDVSEAYRVLLSGATGIVVKKEGVPIGLIARADLVTYWISQKRGGPDEV